jgi:hypothetical protein
MTARAPLGEDGDLTEAEKWFNQRKPGELLTQVSKAEFAGLVEQTLDEKLNFDTLFLSEKKADRIRAKKLLCVTNICQSPPTLMELLTSTWRIIYFRKKEGGKVDVEMRR